MRPRLACPGCDAARAAASGASLIRDRHGLERSRVCSAPQRNQVYADCVNLSACAALRPGNESAKHQPVDVENGRGGGLPVSGLFFTGRCATAARGADTGIEMDGVSRLILRRRGAPSRRMGRRVPSCFETPRHGTLKTRVKALKARLLSMRAGEGGTAQRSEPTSRGERKQRAGCKNEDCFRN
jgi:hypothetical protein